MLRLSGVAHNAGNGSFALVTLTVLRGLLLSSERSQ